MSNDLTLSQKQFTAMIDMAAKGFSPADIGLVVSLSPQEVVDFTSDDGTKKLIDRLVHATMESASRLALNATPEAIKTLVSIMGDEDVNSGVRVTAASRILAIFPQLAKNQIMMQQIEELSKRIDEEIGT